MRVDLIFENPESFEREIEYLFISMAFCCFSFKRYDEAEIYANDGIKFIRKILRNDELLTKIQEYLNEKKHNFDQFITKKNINLAKLMNLQGKISEKLLKRDEAVSYYHQAYNLMKMVQGEENSLTGAFKIDLLRLKEISPASKMKSNMSFPSISELVGSDTNKKEPIINKLVSTKSIIASYNEIPDAIRRTSNKTLKNSSFMVSSLDKDSNLHSQHQRQKCVTLHESCNPEKKTDHIPSKRTPKKEKIRPKSANCKPKSQENLSDFLMKQQRGCFAERSPDMFKIKIFYPREKASKSQHKSEKTLNSDNNTDSQSTKLINSIHFDKNSLKSILRNHRRNPRSNFLAEDLEKEYTWETTISENTKNAKYAMILTPRPPSGNLIPKLAKAPPIQITKVEAIMLENEINEALNNSINSPISKSEETHNQSAVMIQIKEPAVEEHEEKRTGNTTRHRESCCGFSPSKGSLKINNFSTNDSQRNKRRSLLVEKEIKLNMAEINKNESPRSQTIYSDKTNFNKRKNLDTGTFAKQRNDFLLQTPQTVGKGFFKLEGKAASQKEFMIYSEHQDKIEKIQKFFRKIIEKKSRNISNSKLLDIRKESSSIVQESKYLRK